MSTEAIRSFGNKRYHTLESFELRPNLLRFFTLLRHRPKTPNIISLIRTGVKKAQHVETKRQHVTLMYQILLIMISTVLGEKKN